jgi:pyruvate/2-oxoglutarate dehydrogenase complex dihydrolipoamide acyltransferase (E2) component
MKIRVKVPKVGLTTEEVTLVWERAVGDIVAAGELIATVEADKANFELTAPAAGKLAATLAESGSVVPVGTDVAIIETQ